MKRILAIAASAILLTLTGHGQTVAPTPAPTVDVSSFWFQIFIKCQAAGFPENDYACHQLALAAGKIVLNLAGSVTIQPSTIAPTPAPVVTISPPPAPVAPAPVAPAPVAPAPVAPAQ